jgi:hypothetical protein
MPCCCALIARALAGTTRSELFDALAWHSASCGVPLASLQHIGQACSSFYKVEHVASLR